MIWCQIVLRVSWVTFLPLLAAVRGKLFHHLNKWKLIFSVAVAASGRKSCKHTWQLTSLGCCLWGLSVILHCQLWHSDRGEEGQSCMNATVGHKMTKDERMLLLKINPYDESMTIHSSHKVRLRERWPAARRSKSLHVWFISVIGSETRGC